jgi:phosphate transport system substrate-binding protein
MQTTTWPARFGLLASALIVAVACAGPGASPTPTSTATGGAASPPPPSAAPGSVQINGAGATFPFPLYSRWFYEYAFVDASAHFNYQSIGSGGGIKQITEKTVDFGASDAILNADQFAAAPGIQMFPTVAGADVPVYNVSALAEAGPITFDANTISKIFLGTITKWNDPAIAALNPGVTLPDLDIIVVHRSDGSGTTYIWTDYLSNVSDDWKNNVGTATSVQWPVGLGGKGNEGVAGTVLQNDGAIGYVELAYAVANKMTVAKLVNQAGTTVEASLETTQAAMADFGEDMPDTLARSIVNAPGTDSWPVAGYTYLLLYMDQSDCTKAAKLVEFIHWAQDAGTQYATELHYVALPDNVKQQMLAKVDEITCNGAPLH